MHAEKTGAEARRKEYEEYIDKHRSFFTSRIRVLEITARERGSGASV